MTFPKLEPQQLSTQQRLLLSLQQANSKLEAVVQEKPEPIAIIGMRCRLPGGADSSESFWQFLIEAEDVRREAPSEDELADLLSKKIHQRRGNNK